MLRGVREAVHEAGARGARVALLALLAGLTAACDGRARGGDEEYARTRDPGLREEYYWAIVGSGDCPPGDGETRVAGEAEPAAERCDASRFGTIAVCRDGARVPPPDPRAAAQCVYTGRELAACSRRPGGARLWECVRTDAE